MFSTRLDPADSRRGIASFHNLFFYLYIYIYITVYKSEIRFNPMVEKNRNVEEYDIYGIYLHGYLRDFDSGEYRVCLRRISRRSLPWFGGRNLSDQCFLERRAARSIYGVVYGELELGTKFKRTLSPRANFRDTSEIRRIFIIHYRILELT